MFGFLTKKTRVGVGKVGGFGKIAGMGDFVRTPSPSDEMIAFEAWLTRAMETAESRGGNAFKEAFVNGRPFAFLWAGAIDKKQRGLLGGVVQPSVDAVGRRFPVVIGVPLPLATFAGQPHIAPFLLNEFFHQAADAAARASRMQTQAEFHAQVAALQPPSVDGAKTSASTYETWSRQQRAADVWAQLFGDAADRASKWALYLLVEAVKPYRGQELPPLPLGMRVPLGPDRQNTTAMWIDLVRNAAGWKTTVPSIFLPLGPDAREALIQLGAEAPPSVVADLYTPTDDSEAVCDATPAPDSKMPSELPPAVDRATADDTMLSDVATELAR